MWAVRVIAFGLMFSIAIGAGVWLVTPVHAAKAVCSDRAMLVKGLAKRYKEFPVSLGISQKSAQALEIFASKSGTWTAVMTTTSGISCIMAAGHSWHNIPRPKTKS